MTSVGAMAERMPHPVAAGGIKGHAAPDEWWTRRAGCDRQCRIEYNPPTRQRRRRIDSVARRPCAYGETRENRIDAVGTGARRSISHPRVISIVPWGFDGA